MFVSELSILRGLAVLDVDVSDFEDTGFTQELYAQLVGLGVNGCVLSLSSITGLSRSEWIAITSLAQGLELLGIKSVVSGIAPTLAVTLVWYPTPLGLETYLNEDEALDALADQ